LLFAGSIDILVLNHAGQTYFGNYRFDTEHIQKLMMPNVLTHAHMSDTSMSTLKNTKGRIVVVSTGAGLFYQRL